MPAKVRYSNVTREYYDLVSGGVLQIDVGTAPGFHFAWVVLVLSCQFFDRLNQVISSELQTYSSRYSCLRYRRNFQVSFCIGIRQSQYGTDVGFNVPLANNFQAKDFRLETQCLVKPVGLDTCFDSREHFERSVSRKCRVNPVTDIVRDDDNRDGYPQVLKHDR